MRERILSNRSTLMLLAALLLLVSVAPMVLRASAANDSDASKFQFNTANAGPRQLEEQTQTAIKRQYADAWKNLADALEQNRADLVDKSFVGAEQQQLRRQIDEQKKNGLSEKLDDRSHHVDLVFYSPEGTAIELHDTVDLQEQLMDGSKSVHSQSTRKQYVVIFTLVEDKWKVRTMQEVQ